MQNTYAHPKLVSVPTLMILLVAGVAGFIIMSPVPAHAAGPTVTLSATSGTPSGSITISGTGFANGQEIGITSTVGSQKVDWFAGEGSGTANSLTDDCCDLLVSAQGDFMTVVTIPDMPGGPQTITVSDTATTPNTATATFTVTPSVTLKLTETGSTPDTWVSGYPEQVTTGVNVTVHGFGASESVTVNNNGIFSSFNPTLSTTTLGFASTIASATVADTSGGTKNVVATGQTSSLTASTPFIVKPWVSFYNSQSGVTKLSFLGKAPTSVLVEGHGFTSGTNVIAGNSITVGGVATSHSSITVGSDGAFGAGVGNHVVLSPNNDVPFGQVSVVIQGNTFNLANGNINMWNGLGTAGPVLGGVFISSIIGVAGVSTAIGQLDAAGYGYGDSVNILGYGFVPTNVIIPTTTNLPERFDGSSGPMSFAIVTNSIQTLTADPNGAIFIGSADEFGNLAAGSYTVALTGATTANTINPSFTVHSVLTLCC
jgi:hypothetical protein